VRKGCSEGAKVRSGGNVVLEVRNDGKRQGMISEGVLKESKKKDKI
jgi:hypothetical protein